MINVVFLPIDGIFRHSFKLWLMACTKNMGENIKVYALVVSIVNATHLIEDVTIQVIKF